MYHQSLTIKYNIMNEALKSLVVQCIEKNVVFNGGVGSVYTVQELFHVVKLQSINSIYQRTKKELDSLETDSLFENKNTSKEKVLQLQVDTLKEVFSYKQEQEKTAKDAEKRRAEAAEKLVVLKQIKNEKELEALKSMTPEEIEKEIQKYS